MLFAIMLLIKCLLHRGRIAGLLEYLASKVKVNLRLLGAGATDHVITAAGVPDAEPDVALVVDGGGVRELVRLEVDERGGLGHAVLELAHDLAVNGTAAKNQGIILHVPKYSRAKGQTASCPALISPIRL